MGDSGKNHIETGFFKQMSSSFSSRWTDGDSVYAAFFGKLNQISDVVRFAKGEQRDIWGQRIVPAAVTDADLRIL